MQINQKYPYKDAETILDVNNLAVSFRTYGGMVQAVRGISFGLKKGETLAIVGESGSGKSVTTKAILGVLSKNAILESGEILFDGKDLAGLSEKEFTEIRGKRIALVFQDPLSALNPIVKIGRQITEVLRLQGRLSRTEAKNRAIELMGSVGIPEPEIRFHQYPFQFSGGMRQRIVITIALASDPDVLICDEPTTALDVTIQAQILELINQIKEERNLSVIFITHDLGVVANTADRVAVMYAGRIIEIGLSHEIFYDPRTPYAWALLSSMPDLQSKEELYTIAGAPPNMLQPPIGDAFAGRNEYAIGIDFKEHPPFFQVSDTHQAATWLMHPKAPALEKPVVLQHRLNRMTSKQDVHHDA